MAPGPGHGQSRPTHLTLSVRRSRASLSSGALKPPLKVAGKTGKGQGWTSWDGGVLAVRSAQAPSSCDSFWDSGSNSSDMEADPSSELIMCQT